jgi:hypothetical protein
MSAHQHPAWVNMGAQANRLDSLDRGEAGNDARSEDCLPAGPTPGRRAGDARRHGRRDDAKTE